MKSTILSILAVYTICGNTEPVLTFSDGSRAEIKWLNGPALIPEESVLEINWKSPKGDVTSPSASISAEFLMPEHDHGTSPITITETEPGQFKITDIFLTMPGNWQLAITVSPKRGSPETQVLDIPLSLKDVGGCSK